MRLIDADTLLTAYEDTMKELVQATNIENISLEALSLLCGAKLIAEAPTVGGWISVKDRLPKQKWTNYLVATKIQTDGTRGFNIAWVNDDNGVWKSNDEWICDGREIVTHWMPLPEPPKENEDD